MIFLWPCRDESHVTQDKIKNNTPINTIKEHMNLCSNSEITFGEKILNSTIIVCILIF